ncbi:Ribonuclease D [BD1-7 clade bacterium]|nr:Ribonuclease D [BD1-7 clade bacterium]
MSHCLPESDQLASTFDQTNGISYYSIPFDCIEEFVITPNHSASWARPSKETIASMPIFDGLSLAAITVVDNEDALQRARSMLNGKAFIGFDTESKPTFNKGETSNGPHVIQLAVGDHAFLFTPHFMPGVDFALEVLCDESVLKVGFGLKGDRGLFRKKYAVEAAAMVDLARVLKQVGELKNEVGARAAVAMLFQQRLIKSSQRSNWSKFPLTDRQIVYAGNDAYAGWLVAESLQAAGVVLERYR